MQQLRVAFACAMVAACSGGGGGGGNPAIDGPPPHVDAPNLPHDAAVFLDAPIQGLCGNPGTGEGCTSVTWRFVTVSTDGRTLAPSIGCSAQFDTAVIIGRPTDANGVPTGSCDGVNPTSTCMLDLYDCTALTGTQTVAVGKWTNEVQIVDHNGTVVYATSPSNYLGDVGEVNTAVADVDFVTNGGYFRATWATTACAANRAVLVSTPISVDEYDCDAGAGPYDYGAPLPAGAITVTAQMIDPSGDVGNPSVKTVTIAAPSGIVDTGLFTF